MPAANVVGTLAPTWTLDEVVEVLGKLPTQDLELFLTRAGFPGEQLKGLPQASLLEIAFGLASTWESEATSYNEFLIGYTSALCRASFEAFVRLLWEEVPGAAPLKWNWHMSFLCSEGQRICERVFADLTKLYDEVVNISPGTSKSSIFSVMLPAWIWTRMPQARIISASHTDSLVLDLATKSRSLMCAPRYAVLFPEIEFSEEQNAKGHYRNTHGGERKISTIAGVSPLGFHAHVILCLPYETTIITDSGVFQIGEIVEERLPVRVLGYNHEIERTVWAYIEEYESSPGRGTCQVHFDDGSILEATEDHPVYVIGKGYIQAAEITDGDKVVYADQMLSCGACVGGAKTPTTSKKTVTSVDRKVRVPDKVYNIRVKGTHNYFANGVLVHNCDDPIDPKRVMSEVSKKTARDFFTDVLKSRKVDKRVTPTFLIMQRLGVGDPTDVMLEGAKKEGAAPVRHICLPAELTDDVSPPELRKFYEEYNQDAGCMPNGLMDPVRLDKAVLADFKTSAWAYAGQFLQKPVPPGGGIFKAIYFLKRERAAPYNCKRIRYWDRAATLDGGAATAGVLLARDSEGMFYIEHVVHGHWDPVERNQQMRVTAYRDRQKYGKYEPIIWVEREGGASGRDAWLGVVRALEGFVVKEHNVQQMGSKDVRAEPWATQCAAGNVVVIDDGTWDVQGYVDEHERFRFDPTTRKRIGGLVDRVDASSGAFALLVKTARVNSPLRTIALYGKKNTGRWLAVCSMEDLPMLEIDGNPSLFIFLKDPLPQPTIITGEAINPEITSKEVMCNAEHLCGSGPGDIITGTAGGEQPSRGHVDADRSNPPDQPPPPLLEMKLPAHMGLLELNFADLDPADWQEHWGEEIEPWGMKPEDLQMSRDQAKKLWSFLMKTYPKPWQVVVLVDNGGEDARALSMAMGIADQLRIPRSAIYLPGDGEAVSEKEIPPNPYIYDLTKLSRGLVAV